MDEPQDYELYRTPEESSWSGSSPSRRTGVWIAVGLLVAAAGAAGYFAWGWRQKPAETAPTPPVAASRPAPTLGGTAEPIEVPPLDASDTLVRTLVRALSESPAVIAWLTTDDLIRNFALVVTNVGDDVTITKPLTALRPASAFSVIERDGQAYIDPRSYARFTFIADAAASIEPAAAARLYATLKPRIEEANRELGSPDLSFDRTLERAIVALLETPVLDDPVPVRLGPKGIGYAFTDQRLENLKSGQKQLLRMGPRNVRIIKARLREIALALGMSGGQLPRP